MILEEITTKINKEKIKFGLLLALLELTFLFFYYFFCTYSKTTDNNFRYSLWADVNIMAFIGFGLLMTFHRQYFYSAVGYTLLIGSITFQLYPIWQLIWSVTLKRSTDSFEIRYDTAVLIACSFCTDSTLIAFGAIIGKVSPFSLLLLTLIQTIGFSLNEQIGLVLGITDIGGSMYIHLFGACCGLITSKIITT